MNAQPEIVLISRTESDENFLAGLFHEIRAVEFLPLGLPAPALEQLLTMQFRAQNMGYKAQFPNADDRVIWSGDRQVGRLLVDRTGSAMQLVDIALSHDFRGRGLGTRLIGDLIGEGRRRGVPLRLHVRGGNPAARLYERLGFVATGGDGASIVMEILPDVHESHDAKVDLSPAVDSAPVAQESSSRYFRTLIGQTLSACTPEGFTVELRLDSADALDCGHSKDIDPGDSFSLCFSGPTEQALSAALRELTPAGAQPMEIFLVPLGPKDGRMRYEAVFNRAVRAG